MSRQIFNKPPVEGAESETPAAPVERRAVKKPLMGLETLTPRKEGQPVGAFGASLNKINERGKHAEEIEKKLAAGQTIVEPDPTLFAPSFVANRMPLTHADLAHLVDATGESTQLGRILVR